MMDQVIFPDRTDLKPGHWYPIFFRANFDTPERLVAGVVACVDGKWDLQSATALDRLKCLYHGASQVAIAAIEQGLGNLEEMLGKIELDGADLSVSGLYLGKAQEAEAHDAKELARRWLRLISSLHDVKKEVDFYIEVASYKPSPAEEVISREISRDRLPVLVMDKMIETAPQARNMFHQHVHKLEANNKARLITHRAYVAFDGKNVAANFSTLRAGKHKAAVDASKRLMWDLEQHRQGDPSLYGKQVHEMYLYHPSHDDPTISERQFDNVMEIVATLKKEGENREIKVNSRDSVDEISRELLKVEKLI